MNGIIYHAFDTTNGKAYVGQTGWTLKKRQQKHLKSKLNFPFANALRKRPEAFVWTTLTAGLMTQQELDDAEIYWGTFFNTLVPNGYNLMLGKGHTLWSDETRVKHSTSQKIVQNRPEVKQRQRDVQKIITNKPEVRTQRSEMAKVMQNKPEVKAKMSAAMKIAWARRKQRETP